MSLPFISLATSVTCSYNENTISFSEKSEQWFCSKLMKLKLTYIAKVVSRLSAYGDIIIVVTASCCVYVRLNFVIFVIKLFIMYLEKITSVKSIFLANNYVILPSSQWFEFVAQWFWYFERCIPSSETKHFL